MFCPLCKFRCPEIKKREFDKKALINFRYYRCPKCGGEFKTQEKIPDTGAASGRGFYIMSDYYQGVKRVYLRPLCPQGHGFMRVMEECGKILRRLVKPGAVTHARICLIRLNRRSMRRARL